MMGPELFASSTGATRPTPQALESLPSSPTEEEAFLGGLSPPPPPPPPPLQLAAAAAAAERAPVQRSPRLGNSLRRAKTAGKEGTAGLRRVKTANPWPSSGSQAKPLLPLTERASHEQILGARRARNGSQDEDKWDITPDGGSAGREGRQFAVVNVGNNGRIYLRPTVRPAHQRYPQPPFVFPMTPPNTAELEAIAPEQRPDLDTNNAPLPLRDWAPSHPPSPSATTTPGNPGEKQVRIRQRHRRAMSDSTIPDTNVGREPESGGLKVVLTQPGEERPRTVDEEVDLGRPPVLEVAIPSWRIGTPRFSIHGTSYIRDSSYAPTEEARSSSTSFLRLTPLDGASGDSVKPGFVRTSGMATASPHPSYPSSHRSSARAPSTQLRASYLSPRLVIEPSMFDALTFKPACDDRTIVRYSASGSVTAATPPRLVAEITSPRFVDYELLSDFFLTYRSFLEPSNLLRMLFARLRWALSRADDVGQVVRVRTFVALRHWILNYFMDDFLFDDDLRATFCTLLNELVGDVLRDPQTPKVPLKILAELKKCWRRVCAQFWDGPEFDISLGPEVCIAPGGTAGWRDSQQLSPGSNDALPAHLDETMFPVSPRGHAGAYGCVVIAGNIDAVVAGDRPATPENVADGEEMERDGAISPTSITSVDAVSCSFPTRSARAVRARAAGQTAHPARPGPLHNPDLVATTPRALVGRRAREQQQRSHKRNASFGESSREHPTATERALYKNAEFLLALPCAGSLVRGEFLPPCKSLVEVHPHGPDGRQTTIFQPDAVEMRKDSAAPSAMSGQGMKKLLGSVRRALSAKGQHLPPAQGSFINISPIGPRGATTNRLPGTPIVPQASGRQNRGRPPVRIDLLGAEVAEDFRRAVREDSQAKSERSEQPAPPPPPPPPPAAAQPQNDGRGDPSDPGPYSFPTPLSDDFVPTRPTSDMGITTGSQSIVIVDDTSLPSNFPAMTGALPAATPPAEAFSEPFHPNLADPTPPNTPPDRALETPRNSACVLGQHMRRRSPSAGELPPFVPDMDTLGGHPRYSQDQSRHSFDGWGETLGPRSVDCANEDLGVPSHLSFGPYRSERQSRAASFTSTSFHRPTVRSFDATTVSGQSIDDSAPVMAPEPLRVLRRRPGGDLRAVARVGELEHSAALRRSRSVGSLTTWSESIRSSYFRSAVGHSSGYVDVVASDYSPGHAETFSLGALAERNPKQQKISLFTTHSSKPMMRPSFEAEAQKLAMIPDDLDDDGGVESALLKLEGKFPLKKPVFRLSMDLAPPPPPPSPPPPSPPLPAEINVAAPSDAAHAEEKNHATEVDMPEHGEIRGASEERPSSSSGLLDPANAEGRHGMQSFLSDDSLVSYSSIPLLDRDLTDDGHSVRTVTQEWTDRSVLQGPDDDHPAMPDGHNNNAHGPQHPSYEFVERTASSNHVQEGDAAPAAGPEGRSVEQSFLDVDSDNESVISSELSEDSFILENAGDGGVPPNAIGLAISTLPAHPLADNPPSARQPPSPPLPGTQAPRPSPETGHVPTLLNRRAWEKPLPPTPDTTPTATAPPDLQSPLSARDPTGAKEAVRRTPALDMADSGAEPRREPGRNKYTVHLPFILAFDSDVLAQQFTLVEKDALNEIDWKELIDMRWKNAEQNGANVRSWVTFLRDTDARGVEVVIARFNLMVKWAISEIVLTQDVEERARCIIKLIHIAAHCRRYRNFATMSQITIALTSNEVARLARTWALVPAGDRRTLHELETLMSPTRNFYNMRAEMEGGGASVAEMGCIPFVGIYTHDLLFNAQKPNEIASSPTTPPLVNFERCRTAAAVVKTLLRLLEASMLYTFQPIEGITERCLWMGALCDDEIRRLSEALE
ncbi:hypothetical protein VTH06DRAFT_5031 [Thermothelomyces fergusii]